MSRTKPPAPRSPYSTWAKHADFMVIDLLCMQACFVLAYWVTVGFGNPFERDAYQYQWLVVTTSQVAVTFFTRGYSGVMLRGPFAELLEVLKYAIGVLLVVLAFLFLVHNTYIASRLQIGFTFLFFVIVDLALRQLNKQRVRAFAPLRQRSMVLITSPGLAREAFAQLEAPKEYRYYFISSVLLVGGATPDESELESLRDELGVQVEPLTQDTMSKLGRNWVDEVFILQPDGALLPPHLMGDLAAMGITVNYAVQAMGPDRWPASVVRDVGGFQVLTGGMQLAPAGSLALKRLMDIVGSLVGCLLTGVLFLFVAPAIYRASPGPIFYTQERVGRNGRVFRMYKFRSMYLDADRRKRELDGHNKVDDGLMFKVEGDPRIIGSEHRRRDGSPGGVGNFIRRTSIDEFPQFFNVLRGDMSLVGTRPPTLDEWERYDLAHRSRMSAKPGITGMWQISGRSEITDFDEVVRLDREYIENWSLSLDIKILLKTLVVVFRRDGAQ